MFNENMQIIMWLNGRWAIPWAIPSNLSTYPGYHGEPQKERQYSVDSDKGFPSPLLHQARERITEYSNESLHTHKLTVKTEQDDHKEK